MDINLVFAKNLRLKRREMGLTQRDLADLLGNGYTEKAISKWESGNNLPPSVILPKLAFILKTSIDLLMREPSGTTYYLGIDGGGTKTEFVLEDESGGRVRRVVLDGCNPNAVGIAETKKILKSGILKVCEGVDLSSVVAYAGIAGCKTGDYDGDIRELFDEMRFVKYDVGSDNDSIIAAGLGDGEGISVILGTGICAYAVTKGGSHRIAGWGYMFDNGGSAYHIGRDAVGSVFSFYDGSGKETSLVGRIEGSSGCSETELLKKLYKGGNKLVASYASIVFEEAEKGDEVAESILKKNFDEVARIIRAALAHFPRRCGRVPVVLAGGLTKRADILTRIKNAMGNDAEKCEWNIFSTDPVDGALMLAKKIRGNDGKE